MHSFLRTVLVKWHFELLQKESEDQMNFKYLFH